MGKPVVITDLDNTLLDEKYQFTEAVPVLERLKSLRIPLIFATSKTFGETLYFQKLAGISDPFVVENGGAAYIPKKFLKEPFFDGDYYEIPLGVPFEELMEFMEDFSLRHGEEFLYLHSLSPEEASRLTGLPPHLAKLARRRDWDVTFLPKRQEVIPILKEEAEKRGWRLQKGGIFYHLTGNHTKADALKKVLRDSGLEGSLIIALGDSPNDLDMLKMADVPVLVSATGETEEMFKKEIGNVRIFRERASLGWAKALREVLKEIEGGE